MASLSCLNRHGETSDPDLIWVLDLAFGPAKSDIRKPFDPSRAVSTAIRLGLAARIAGRKSAAALEAALGLDARKLAFERLRLKAEHRALDAARERVSEIAEKRGVHLLWLKFAALRLRGLSPVEGREARDLDLLAPEAEGRELHAALCEAGFRQATTTSADHQLPALVEASGAAVEVHRTVWGMDPRQRGAFAANFDDFRVAGVITVLPDGSRVPTDLLLASHAIVHALVQHRATPRDYAPFRVLADLVDLHAWAMPAAAVHAPIAARLAVRDVADACALAGALSRGQSWTELDPRGRALLSSLLEASLDQDVQDTLGLTRLVEVWSEGTFLATLWRGVRGAPLRRSLDLARGLAAYGRMRRRRPS